MKVSFDVPQNRAELLAMPEDGIDWVLRRAERSPYTRYIVIGTHLIAFALGAILL